MQYVYKHIYIYKVTIMTMMIKYLIAYDGYLKFDLTDIRTKAMTV